jgi:hypothetical protein
MTVQASGDIKFADCAEDFEIANTSCAEPGTVMVMDDKGVLTPCIRAYDTRAIGIVSGAADLRPAIVLGRCEDGLPRAPVALAGKVFCKVDADRGPIRCGDLLTTSETEGHAMAVRDAAQALGAVVGKALRPFPAGRGLIPVLVLSR